MMKRYRGLTATRCLPVEARRRAMRTCAEGDWAPDARRDLALALAAGAGKAPRPPAASATEPCGALTGKDDAPPAAVTAITARRIRSHHMPLTLSRGRAGSIRYSGSVKDLRALTGKMSTCPPTRTILRP